MYVFTAKVQKDVLQTILVLKLFFLLPTGAPLWGAGRITRIYDTALNLQNLTVNVLICLLSHLDILK